MVLYYSLCVLSLELDLRLSMGKYFIFILNLLQSLADITLNKGATVDGFLRPEPCEPDLTWAFYLQTTNEVKDTWVKPTCGSHLPGFPGNPDYCPDDKTAASLKTDSRRLHGPF